MIICLAIALPIATFNAMPVNAEQGKNKPRGPKSPETTMDLYNDATANCDGINSAPCVLLFTTVELDYTGRNHTKIEETLKRDAASIVIEIQDAIDTQAEELDANSKWCQAIKSLLSYNLEYYTSKSEEKISGLAVDVATIEGDIGTDGNITEGDIWGLITTLANPSPTCD